MPGKRVRSPRRRLSRLRAQLRAEAERPLLVEPAPTSHRDQLTLLFARIDAGIERAREAGQLEYRANRKLDALESEFLSLCDEIATVSTFARQRVERPNLGAFAVAAANLGASRLPAADGSAADRPAAPQMDRDPARASRRRRRTAVAASAAA